MAAVDDINRIFREFNRYTGDGLPNPPTNAPLPIGDPQSGVCHPKKSEIRWLFGNLATTFEQGVAYVQGVIPAITAARDQAISAVETTRDQAIAEVEASTEEAEAAAQLAVQAADQAAVVGAGDVPTYPSRTLAAASNIPPARTYILLAGYGSPGDGGKALYKRVASEPSHQGKFQSKDGAWWELAETTVNPIMFGADGTGTADATTAINSAIGFGTAVVDLAGRTYRVDGTINLRSNLLLHNGKIDASNAPNSTRTFHGLGTQAAGVALSANANAGAYTATVTSAASFAAEDLVYIQSATLYDTLSSGGGSYYGEFARIKSISNNTLTFYDALRLTYTTADTGVVHKLAPIKNVTLRDIEATGSAAATGTMFAEFYYCENILLENVRSDRFQERHVQLRRTYQATVTRSSFRRSWATGTSYGVAINDGASYINVIDNRFEDFRHAVAIGGTQGVCRSIKAHLNHCLAMRDAGLDSHPAAADVDYSYNTIECAVGAQAGTGIIAQCPDFKAHGNIIRNCNGIGIYHQMMCTVVGRSDICDNEIYGVGGSSLGISVETNPAATAIIHGVTIRGNKTFGFPGAVRVYAIGQSIQKVDIDGNQAINTISGVFILVRSLTGKIVRDVLVRGNIAVVNASGTGILLQADDASGVFDGIISHNRIQGSSYGIRGLNTNYILTDANSVRAAATTAITVDGAGSVLGMNIT